MGKLPRSRERRLQKDTPFELVALVTMGIAAGTWTNRVNSLSLVLQAGANCVTKFPMIKLYRSPQALQIKEQAEKEHIPYCCLRSSKLPAYNRETLEEELADYRMSTNLLRSDLTVEFGGQKYVIGISPNSNNQFYSDYIYPGQVSKSDKK